MEIWLFLYLLGFYQVAKSIVGVVSKGCIPNEFTGECDVPNEWMMVNCVDTISVLPKIKRHLFRTSGHAHQDCWMKVFWQIIISKWDRTRCVATRPAHADHQFHISIDSILCKFKWFFFFNSKRTSVKLTVWLKFLSTKWTYIFSSKKILEDCTLRIRIC